MWSIAFTQTANCVVFALMLALGAAAFLINPGIAGLADRPQRGPRCSPGPGSACRWWWHGSAPSSSM
jgi:hypothetical protein